jgi:hypothetical protein
LSTWPGCSRSRSTSLQQWQQPISDSLSQDFSLTKHQIRPHRPWQIRPSLVMKSGLWQGGW